MSFRIIWAQFPKASTEVLINIALDIYINLKRNDIVTMLSLPTNMTCLCISLSSFMTLSFHIVSAYLLLNSLLGYFTYTVVIVEVSSPNSFIF